MPILRTQRPKQIEKYPPMNEAEAAAGVNPPPMIPSTVGDRIHNAVSDVATGVATWGTSFRPPTDEEKKLGRGTWYDRAKLLSGAATQGMANELVGAGIGKIARNVSGIIKNTPAVIKSSYIDTGNKMFNKQDVIEDMISSQGDEAKEILRNELPKLSKEEFAKYAKKAGFTDLGHHWTVSSSGVSSMYKKCGGLLKYK